MRTGGVSGHVSLCQRGIPASVRYVDWRAFGNCTNLKELVIEGDLSRVADWDRDAFEGCPCSEYCSRMYRETYRKTVTDQKRISKDLKRSLRTKPLYKPRVIFLLELCTDDGVLSDIVCSTIRSGE